MADFLPVSAEEMRERGWSEPDFVFVSGDAYVDHPSFGTAIISRVLEDAGYNVAILPQPNFRSCEDFKRFGRPRLGFLVNAGNIDSMVAHYTVSKKKRNYDYYSPGGKIGLRPDRALIVYCKECLVHPAHKGSGGKRKTSPRVGRGVSKPFSQRKGRANTDKSRKK